MVSSGRLPTPPGAYPNTCITGRGWRLARALKIGEGAKVAPIDKLSVVLVAVFGVIFLGERLTAPNWLGIALIAVGAVLVAYR